jgi:hypothetical protein
MSGAAFVAICLKAHGSSTPRARWAIIQSATAETVPRCGRFRPYSRDAGSAAIAAAGQDRRLCRRLPIRFIRGIGQAYRLRRLAGQSHKGGDRDEGRLGDDCADRQEPNLTLGLFIHGTLTRPGLHRSGPAAEPGSSAPDCRSGPCAVPFCARAPRPRRTPLYQRRGRARAQPDTLGSLSVVLRRGGAWRRLHLAGGFKGPSAQRWAMTDLSGSSPSQSTQRSFGRPSGSAVSETSLNGLPHAGQGFLISRCSGIARAPSPWP